jgi:hypothetical protein
MRSSTPSRWIGLCGAAALAAIAVASLIPAKWQLRTGLPWQLEHFFAYFAATFIACLAWFRPFVVAGSLMALAGAMEALQGLTSDRARDLATALSRAGGVLTAALLGQLVIRWWKGRASARRQRPTARNAGAGALQAIVMYP